MHPLNLPRYLSCGLLTLSAAAAWAQSAPIPGPATDLYPGTREYVWTFHVPVMSVERREIVFQGPRLAVRSRRFDYEVPGLTYERRRLFPVAEFYCKYPDLQLPNECGVAWHEVYADFPQLTTRREHIDVDVAEWTSEETRIRVDVPHWTWTERTLTIVVPVLETEPAPLRTWARAPEVMVAGASIERARQTLDSNQAEATRTVDAAVAELNSTIGAFEAQGADASKLTSVDGTKLDLYATRQALVDDKARQLTRYAQIRAELGAAGVGRDASVEAR